MYEVIFIGGESHGENISLNSILKLKKRLRFDILLIIPVAFEITLNSWVCKTESGGSRWNQSGN